MGFDGAVGQTTMTLKYDPDDFRVFVVNIAALVMFLAFRSVSLKSEAPAAPAAAPAEPPPPAP